MSAAQFASRQVRSRNIPAFRDMYTEKLAANPLTEFDFIGHSNGTYIFGHSLLSTPSMQFNHVVLAAPVLPTDFDWNLLLQRRQVKAVRYDAADEDWPVGILCPLLNAVGFSDVGPSGVVLFGEGRMMGSSFVKNVGWYHGGHGAALRFDPAQNIDNRRHLLSFAYDGQDLSTDEKKMEEDPGAMRTYSRLTKWLTWALLGLAALWVVRRYRSGKRISLSSIVWALGLLLVLYVALDVV
jgi:pimeloyl-ACP methyl ester carboxylesterase